MDTYRDCYKGLPVYWKNGNMIIYAKTMELYYERMYIDRFGLTYHEAYQEALMDVEENEN